MDMYINEERQGILVLALGYGHEKWLQFANDMDDMGNTDLASVFRHQASLAAELIAELAQ